MVRHQFCFAIIFFLLSHHAFAQQHDTEIISSNKNIFKINLAAAGLYAVNIQYERRIGKKTTAAIGIYKRFDKSIYNYLDRRNESPLYDIRMSSMGVTPEVKYYFTDKEFLGLYVGTFARWRKDQMQYSYKATGLNTIDKANIQIEDNVFNVGLLLGYQVHLGKKVYLDCWLVGLGLRHSKVAGTAQTNFEMSQPLSYPQMYSFLEGIYNANLSYTINGTQTSFVGESWQPAFRGGGICIGVRF